MGHAYPRIREIERRLEIMENQARDAKKQLAAVRQGIGDFGGRVAFPHPIMSNATIHGTVNGCFGNAIPDAGTITATVQGISYGPFATSGGSWSINVYVTSTATVSLTYTPGTGGLWSRFQSITNSSAGSVSPGGSATMATLTVPPSSGFACIYGCSYPIPTTLHLTDSFFGTSPTLTYSAGSWSGTATISTSALSCGPYPPTTCPAASGVQLLYVLAANGSPLGGSAGSYLLVVYTSVLGAPYTGCPTSSGSSNGPSYAANVSSSIVSCSPFSFTCTMPSGCGSLGQYLYTGGGTITVTE